MVTETPAAVLESSRPIHLPERFLALLPGIGLLLVIGYLGQLYGPLKTMSKKTSQLQSAMASAERAMAVLDEPHDVGERPDARPLPKAIGAIEFRQVSFGYTPDTPVLPRAAGTIE